jgi:hypothetical protein
VKFTAVVILSTEKRYHFFYENLAGRRQIIFFPFTGIFDALFKIRSKAQTVFEYVFQLSCTWWQYELILQAK